MSADERQPLFSDPTDTHGPKPIWRENKDKKPYMLIMGGFLAFIVFNLILSILMASIQAYKVNKLFIILLVNVLVIAQVPFCLVFFIYKDYVSQKHFYAVFVTGVAVIIECISTDILVFVT